MTTERENIGSFIENYTNAENKILELCGSVVDAYLEVYDYEDKVKARVYEFYVENNDIGIKFDVLDPVNDDFDTDEELTIPIEVFAKGDYVKYFTDLRANQKKGSIDRNFAIIKHQLHCSPELKKLVVDYLK